MRFAKVSDTRSKLRPFSSLLCALALFSTIATSVPVTLVRASVDEQQPKTAATKRPLTHKDYDSWRSIQAPQISRDGKYVAYAYMPQDGDGEIVVRTIASTVEWRAPRGYRPPVPPPDDPGANAAEFAAGQARLLRPVFTADSKFVVFGTEPTKAELTKAKKEKKRPEEMPKNGMGIIDLSTGTVSEIERVKSFQVPEDGSGFIAYSMEAPVPERPAREAGAPTPPAENAGAAPATPRPQPQTGRNRRKEYGTELVVRNMSTGTERKFPDVLDYTFSKDAKSLVFATSSRKEETNGIFALTPQTDVGPVTLLSGKGKYQKLTWDEDNTQLAFISDKDDSEAKQPRVKIYQWNRKDPTATEIVSISSAGFRKEFVISERALN